MSADLLAFWNDRLAAQAGLFAWRALLALAAVLVLVVAARVVQGATQRGLARTRAHVNARLLIGRLVQVTFLLLAAVWVLGIFGVQPTALVAVLGVVGLAVSLALQDVLKNLVAGLYILIERPFAIGEQIEFKTFSGIVEAIELRTTALRTATSQRVVIPNAMLFTDVLVNRSTYGRQLARVRVAAPLSATPTGSAEAADQQLPSLDPQELTQELLAAAKAVDGTLDGTAPAVLLEALSAEKATFRAEVWAGDAKAVASQLAWAIRVRLPRAEITVLD